MAETASKEKKKPGRKPETPAQRLERLERDIAVARKAVSDAEQQTLSVVGRAVLAEAADDDAFRERLHVLLKARVTAKAAKAAIMSVIG